MAHMHWYMYMKLIVIFSARCALESSATVITVAQFRKCMPHSITTISLHYTCSCVSLLYCPHDIDIRVMLHC